MTGIKARRGILVLQHADGEGPGYLATLFARRGLAFQIRHAPRGDAAVLAGDAFAGIVLLGGPMSVNDPLPWIGPELDLIRSAVEHLVPVLGICLGGQLIAKALGGTVGPNPVPEIGWLPVERVESPAAARWLDGLPARFDVCHWHGETFTIPQGAERFLKSDACSNQGFVLESALALQCHPEVDEPLLRDWAAAIAHEAIAPSATVQTPEQLLSRAHERLSALQRVADVILGRWVDDVARVARTQ